MRRLLTLMCGSALAFAAPAAAHTGLESLSGFASGLMHPFAGLDHLLAMIAIGMWAAQQRGRAVYVIPVAFVTTMALGGAIALAGATFGATETAIVGTVLITGALVAAAFQPPLWLAVPLVATFAIVHGLAHGAEVPDASDAPGYVAGLLLATAALHGIGLALAVARPWPVRALGAAQIAAGILIFTGVF